jgi:hypothetical protein
MEVKKLRKVLHNLKKMLNAKKRMRNSKKNKKKKQLLPLKHLPKRLNHLKTMKNPSKPYQQLYCTQVRRYLAKKKTPTVNYLMHTAQFMLKQLGTNGGRKWDFLNQNVL